MFANFVIFAVQKTTGQCPNYRTFSPSRVEAVAERPARFGKDLQLLSPGGCCVNFTTMYPQIIDAPEERSAADKAFDEIIDKHLESMNDSREAVHFLLELCEMCAQSAQDILTDEENDRLLESR